LSGEKTFCGKFVYGAWCDYEDRMGAVAQRLTGGEAIAESLLAHGVDTVFGLPGVQLYGLFDAFYKARSRIRTIAARHEQGAGYMAFGYARSTGRPSAYAVVPGEGMLNASAALATAQSVNTPVLCLTGQAPTPFLDRGRGQLHEISDQLGTMRTLTKWAERISTPADAPELVARAFQEMRSGRPGTAALEMPWDVFTRAEEVEAMEPLALQPEAEPDADVVKRAADLMKSAGAPMIFAGGGAVGAGEEVLELAKMLEAPVVSFRNGRGVVSAAHDLQMTAAAAYKIWPATDLVIGIGTRLETMGWRWPFTPQGLKSIRVDIDPAEMERFQADAGIVAGAQAGTRALIDAARKAGVPRSGRLGAIQQAKIELDRELREKLPEIAFLDAIRDVLPHDGIFVDELCQAGFVSWLRFPVYRPRTFLSAGYSGNLGYGFPTALGAKVANPDKQVVSICGDGGFLFCAQELATAVQYGISIAIVLFNNNAYGNVLRDQQLDFGGRVIGSELKNPDFLKLADAFGVPAVRVRTAEELRPALERALGASEPWLIEVPRRLEEEGNPWPWIMPPSRTS
jgi:acetolactate synthase-1/2/3 large subunit